MSYWLLYNCGNGVDPNSLTFLLNVRCTQEQLLGFELLRECRMCFTQHQEFVKVVYLLLHSFAVQLIGSCDTVLVVLSRCWQLSSHRYQLC